MSDLIKRQDALDAIQKDIDMVESIMAKEGEDNYEHDIGHLAGLTRAKTNIMALPSADRNYERATEDVEHCIRYEQTYSLEDGSM